MVLLEFRFRCSFPLFEATTEKTLALKTKSHHTTEYKNVLIVFFVDIPSFGPIDPYDIVFSYLPSEAEFIHRCQMLAYRVDYRYSLDGQMSHDEHVTCEPADGCAGRRHGNPLIGSSLAVKLLTDLH